jgi:hypothetical protein
VPRLLPLVALVPLIVACRAHGERAAATAVPFTTRVAATPAARVAAVELVPRRTARFTLALPAGWQEVALSAEAIQQAAREAEGRNVHLVVVLRSLLEGERYKQMEYFAFDPATADSVNVLRAPIAPGTTAAQVLEQVRQALPQTVPGVRVTDGRADLRVHGRAAALVEYELRVLQPGVGMQTYQGVQVYVLDGEAVYVISVNGPAGEGFTALAGRIAETFEPLP